jgi:hypothetical protein
MTWPHRFQILRPTTDRRVVQEHFRSYFLPALLYLGLRRSQRHQKTISLSTVKHSELALRNPTTVAESNWKAYTLVCGHLIAALRGRTDFISADHANIVAQGKARAIRKRSRSQEAYGKSMETILSTIPDGKSRTIRRGTETGAWLSVLPSTVSRTDVSAQGFRDALSMRYAGDAPPDLPVRCDGCRNAPFTLQHALACKKGGLVLFRHNEIRDELVSLAGKALTPSAVRDELLIKSSRAKESEKDAPITDTSQKKTEQTATGKDERGDLLVRGFWARGTDCVLDARVTDTDAKSYSKRDPAKVLVESQEKEKKRKYLEACLERRRHFTPFVCSVDGMLG